MRALSNAKGAKKAIKGAMPLGPREKGRSTKRERDGNLLSDREGAKTALEKTIDLINESIS